MRDITRQELGGLLSMSESKIKSLEKQGMPCIQPEGSRRKLYNLREVKLWLGRVDREKAAALTDGMLRNFYGANARAKSLKRMPAWCDKSAMRAVYEEARRLTLATGIVHQVDHFYPLQGEIVSGLHVPTNLQILTGSENCQKSNRYEVEP